MAKRINPKDLGNFLAISQYGFDFDSVSEEDIIKGAIESNVSVFLHGMSSDGKSARIKELDPDCEIIYMRNATPESLNGKSVYNAKDNKMYDIPPTWFEKLVKKCSDEPNKLHLVFFDELTNATPVIQGMAFNIILEGEVNGKWKLPQNARVVAAGNEVQDSTAANQMVEPLFNRFAHVYIKTNTKNWLTWALDTEVVEESTMEYKESNIKHKIHPMIIKYIAHSKMNDNNRLRSRYTGEEPNADPRKWEMASKVLYTTKKPEMLRALVGKHIARDFIEFCYKLDNNLDKEINDYLKGMGIEKKKVEEYTNWDSKHAKQN